MDVAMKGVEEWLDLSSNNHALVILIDGTTGISGVLDSHAQVPPAMCAEDIASPCTIHHLMLAMSILNHNPSLAFNLEYILTMHSVIGEKDIKEVLSEREFAHSPKWLKQQYKTLKPYMDENGKYIFTR